MKSWIITLLLAASIAAVLISLKAQVHEPAVYSDSDKLGMFSLAN